MTWNYSYYPVIFESEDKLLEVQKVLNEEQIFPRRYFYPSLNTIEFIKGEGMPVSENIASCIMCLPLYKGLVEKELENICLIINKNTTDD
jgi:dTDP-4-amino-4,6-dideoxygalactose transaminase